MGVGCDKRGAQCHFICQPPRNLSIPNRSLGTRGYYVTLSAAPALPHVTPYKRTSSTVFQTITQEIIQFRDVVDFFDGGIDIVFNPSITEKVIVG